ncbi:MAG: hypothetical protein R3343_08895, partial [Nitriliruptorales bacterium]|nr:hypothetical protein [Nitriliruptorales bacterium]
RRLVGRLELDLLELVDGRVDRVQRPAEPPAPAVGTNGLAGQRTVTRRGVGGGGDGATPE